jgi:hypothetical protein
MLSASRNKNCTLVPVNQGIINLSEPFHLTAPNEREMSNALNILLPAHGFICGEIATSICRNSDLKR